MADDKKQPIVIKKIVKGGGHHGGAWKVAYADFVTAMMAFFLLLWLLGISDEAMRGGISDMFRNPSPLIGPGGTSSSMIKLGGTKEIPRGEGDQIMKQAEILKHMGFERYVEGFLAANAYGTPDQMIKRFRERYEVIGSFELATCFRFGGIPYEEAEASMRLFAREVLPELQSWA